MKPLFFLQKDARPFFICTNSGPMQAFGRAAYIPDLPGCSFFYHDTAEGVRLTEARTGLAFATEQFYGRRHLHHQVDFILKTRGVEAIRRQIDRCTPKLPLNR